MTVREFQKEFGIIGSSSEIKNIILTIMQVAKSDVSVLLIGESGVGKEVFAKAIHRYSHRADKPMVSVNCGAIPESLIESELFGHVKGAYTGASDSRKGYFELADGGTLFLDEIGEMPYHLQVKLLRAIEYKEFLKVGDEKVTKVDVRIIAATNRDLEQEVEDKKFRKDLYYRLKSVVINIPPLRERKADIDELVFYFISQYAKKHNINEISITDEAKELLRNYHWPGNVRELKSVIETACAISSDHILNDKIFLKLLKIERAIQVVGNYLPQQIPSKEQYNQNDDLLLIKAALVEIKKDLIDIKFQLNDLNKNHNNNNEHIVSFSEVTPLKELEKNEILKALNYTKWNKRQAAKLLGINERTLYRKLDEYNIK
jgi:transcriptional regulator with GAF, ATPase, and Fis domain